MTAVDSPYKVLVTVFGSYGDQKSLSASLSGFENDVGQRFTWRRVQYHVHMCSLRPAWPHMNQENYIQGI